MADADAQRLSPRRRDDPSFLGGGAHLRPSRPGSGPPKRWHPRAAVESVRPDAEGPADGLGRATELPVTRRRGGRAKMAVLAESNVASRIPAQDLRRARSFYAQKLGLEPVGARRYDPGMPGDLGRRPAPVSPAAPGAGPAATDPDELVPHIGTDEAGKGDYFG